MKYMLLMWWLVAGVGRYGLQSCAPLHGGVPGVLPLLPRHPRQARQAPGLEGGRYTKEMSQPALLYSGIRVIMQNL